MCFLPRFAWPTARWRAVQRRGATAGDGDRGHSSNTAVQKTPSRKKCSNMVAIQSCVPQGVPRPSRGQCTGHATVCGETAFPEAEASERRPSAKQLEGSQEGNGEGNCPRLPRKTIGAPAVAMGKAFDKAACQNSLQNTKAQSVRR